MRIADTHAHLDVPAFADDLPAVLRRAEQAGLERIICVGTDLASSRRCVELARRLGGLLRAAVGIHPNSWADAAAGDFEALAELAAAPEVLAVGETGLDFHHDRTPRPAQLDAFRRHLALARRLGKPLIVHARKADDAVLDTLTEWGPMAGVRHCFDASAQVAERYLALGFHVSFAGTITRPGHRKLKAAARALPLDRLLVETDCPYQTPAGRGKVRNEPAFIVDTVQALAALRAAPPEEIAAATAANARRLFG